MIEIEPDSKTTAELAAELTAATRQRERVERAAGIVPPSLAELGALDGCRRGTVRASARAGSQAHLTELTDTQLRVLWAADNPAGYVSQNGSTGITRPSIKALDAKGYGRAIFDARRRHLVIGFEINARGRAAARERFGTPGWAISVHDHQPPSIQGHALCGRVVVRPNGTAEQCGEPVKSAIHDPAEYPAYRTELAAELAKWRAGTGEYASASAPPNSASDDRADLVHPFAD